MLPGYILLPGCSGKPARQNKNRMSVKSCFEEFASRLRDFIALSSAIPEASHTRIFESLALELFALQFENNLAYRKICDARHASPQTIEHWTQIPPVPTTAFKELELSCLPVQERTFSFHSSGTTQQRPSRHFHNAESLTLYETSLWAWFVAQRFPDNQLLTSDHRNGSVIAEGSAPMADQRTNADRSAVFAERVNDGA